jgi:hypothetical protein
LRRFELTLDLNRRKAAAACPTAGGQNKDRVRPIPSRIFDVCYSDVPKEVGQGGLYWTVEVALERETP